MKYKIGHYYKRGNENLIFKVIDIEYYNNIDFVDEKDEKYTMQLHVKIIKNSDTFYIFHAYKETFLLWQDKNDYELSEDEITFELI